MKKINIGKENATFQEILSLKENRTKRTKTGLFFVEGVQNIKDSLANNWKIHAFIYSKDCKLSKWATEILDFAEFNYVLENNLMLKLSDKSDVSEVLAIVEIKYFNSICKTDENPVFVLLDRPSKKGNLGTIIRSCDALNVTQIFYSGHSVDLYDHAVVTASMGSFFKLPITFIKSNNDYLALVEQLKKQYANLQIVATSLQTENKLQNANFNFPTLLLIGNETDGLCKFYNETADYAVKIDMRPDIDSLNIACATSICLYEIQRQRNNYKI